MKISWPALIIVTLAGIYAFIIEPLWFDITLQKISTKNTQTIRVVQLSDLHLPAFGWREKSLIREVKSLQPDLVLLTGDVIDKSDKLPELALFLEALDGIKVVATLGNWEYWSNVDLRILRALYTKYSVPLLVNEEKLITLNGRNLRLVGLDDFTAGKPKVEAFIAPAMADISILIEHSPGFFDSPVLIDQKNNPKHFELCLAGHTHAGQITIFGWPLWTPPGSGSYVSGWYDTPTCKLYVSRGIGTSILHARFFSRPEIAVFEM
jgi:predicted MPP superfamily phosphohydrolase